MPGPDVSAELRPQLDQIPSLAAFVAEIVDGVGRTVYVSPQVERLVGFTREEFRSTPGLWARQIHPEDRLRILEQVARTGETGGPLRMEYRFITKDGRIVWIRDEAAVVKDEAAGRTIIQGVMIDITEIRRREEEQRFQKSLLECQSEASIDGILVVSPEGKMISFNRRFVEMWGLSDEVIRSRSDDLAIQSVLHKLVDPEGFLTRVRYLYKRDEKSQDEIQLKDGRVFDRYSTPIRGAEGHDYGRIWFFRDVTEQRRSEQLLRRLSHALEQSPSIVVITDSATHIQYANRKFTEISGFTPQEVLGSLATDLGEQPEDERRVMLETLGAGQEWRGEFRNRKKGGGFYWESASISVLHGKDGGETYYVKVAEDVTERKRAERRLAAQHAVTRILADSPTLREATPRIIQAVCECLEWDMGAIWIVDPVVNRLRCVELWRAPAGGLAQFTKITREMLFERGIGLPGRVWKEERPAWIEDVVRDSNFPRAPVADREGLHGAFGFPIRVREDIHGVIEFFSREIRRPDEDLLRMMEAIGVQIGQFIVRRRAEEELRASEEKYRAVVETANDAIISADQNGNIIFFNRGAERMFGRTAADVRGKPLTLLMPKEYRARHERGLERFLVSGRERVLGRTTEFAGLRPDGSEFPLEISLARWKTGEGVFFTGILRDITERKSAEQELRMAAEETQRAYDDLKRAQRDLIRAEKLASAGMVMAGIAHEINNPLNVVYGNLRLIKERCTATQARIRAGERPSTAEMRTFNRMIADALVGAENARRILEEFRHFARDSREAEPADLRRCIEDAVESVRPLARERVKVAARIGRLPEVRVFPGQIRRAIANLLKNAIEAIQGRGTVTLTATRRNGMAVIEVRDTGHGIPPGEIDRIFEPFYSTKEHGKGFGLGLALCEAVVHNHGGEVDVRSKVGRGACFTIRLPIR